MSDEGSDTEAARGVKVSKRLQGFWKNHHAWPKDRTGHIFLAEAVDLLGTERFGDHWVAITDPTLTEAYDQRSTIFEYLADRLATGELTTYTREFVGGDCVPIPGNIWNTESYRKRFEYCLVNRAKPFDRSDDETDGSYIFLNRAAVEALIGGPTQKLRIDDVDRLPRFLAALVRTAVALQLTADSPAQPSSIYETKFREVARQSGIEVGLSNRLVEYAGTILRPPGAGRAASKK